jgi:hypothetical protein
LEEDVAERTNLVSAQTLKALELRDMLTAWRKKIGAQLPTKNADFDQEKDGAKQKKKAAAKK